MTEDTPDQPDATSADAATPARRGLFRKRTPAEPAEAPVVVDAESEETPDRTRPGVLRRRRRALVGKYEQGIFDLGGLALELHRRGLLAEEVMRRKAAEVSDLRGQVDQVDERLDEIRSERTERRQTGRGGGRTCPACGARCSAKAKFCAECGTPLAAAEAPAPAGTDDQPTIVIADGSAQETQVIATDGDQRTEVFPAVKVDE
jgi:hypothetical protein